jgi:hypothetical protein
MHLITSAGIQNIITISTHVYTDDETPNEPSDFSHAINKNEKKNCQVSKLCFNDTSVLDNFETDNISSYMHCS